MYEKWFFLMCQKRFYNKIVHTGSQKSYRSAALEHMTK